jgi:hypothetical protein
MRKIISAGALCFVVSAGFASALDNSVSQYPELPAARNLIRVAKSAVDRLATKYQLSPPQTSAALRFVLNYQPVREFEQLSVSDEPTLRRGHKDIGLRKTWEYRRDYDSCDVVSTSMAKLLIGDAVRIYERRFLRPDQMTRELFAANQGKAEQTSISGIMRKTTLREFKKETNSDFQTHPGDAIYFYSAFNRTGYLVVRNNRVVKDQVSAVF